MRPRWGASWTHDVVCRDFVNGETVVSAGCNRSLKTQHKPQERANPWFAHSWGRYDDYWQSYLDFRILAVKTLFSESKA